mgnify:CR=1 FL=1
MAKVKGPLMSLDASGTIAGDTRLRHMRGHVLMYRGGEPGSVRRKAPSATQAQVRAKFADARARWRTLSPPQRAYWQAVAQELGAGLSAWNCFLSCVLLGGAACSTGYQVPPLSEVVTLKSGYSPPPLATPLIFALSA